MFGRRQRVPEELHGVAAHQRGRQLGVAIPEGLEDLPVLAAHGDLSGSGANLGRVRLKSTVHLLA